MYNLEFYAIVHQCKMNIIFHTTTAIGVAVLLTDTKRLEHTVSLTPILVTAIFAFVVGVCVHGVLDYTPHCYPINSKADVVIGLLIILSLTRLAKKKFRIIVAFSFLGSVFPDLVDLSLPIINKQLGLALPTFKALFPWHWHEYSGSIYNGDCAVSTINHLLLLLTITIICWCRRTDLKKIF